MSCNYLKVQPCKLSNNKDNIASAQMTNTEIFTFIILQTLKLLKRNFLFINRKDNINC